MYQPDITSERYIPVASTSEFENDWNFDDTALYANDEALPEAIPSFDDLLELNSQSKTFINLDSGQELSNSKNDLVAPIVGNSVVMIPDGSRNGGKLHFFDSLEFLLHIFIIQTSRTISNWSTILQNFLYKTQAYYLSHLFYGL